MTKDFLHRRTTKVRNVWDLDMKVGTIFVHTNLSFPNIWLCVEIDNYGTLTFVVFSDGTTRKYLLYKNQVKAYMKTILVKRIPKVTDDK